MSARSKRLWAIIGSVFDGILDVARKKTTKADSAGLARSRASGGIGDGRSELSSAQQTEAIKMITHQVLDRFR